MTDGEYKIARGPCAIPIGVRARHLPPTDIKVHGSRALPLEISVSRTGRPTDIGNVQRGGSKRESLAPGRQNPVIGTTLGTVVIAAIAGPLLGA